MNDNELGIITDNYSIYQGDCLEVMDKLIKQNVKVDAIITDPPYGTTKCKWDTVIPFDEMWERLNKLIKPNGAIVLFGSEPFSSALRMSNIKNYRYDLIWEKEQGTDFGNANRKPLKIHENISIFYKKQPTYNPQFTEGKPYTDKRTNKRERAIKNNKLEHRNIIFGSETIPIENKGTRYPTTVIKVPKEKGVMSGYHPTQKPIKLLEWLIKTYTNEGDLVLDFTMGSGSTGVACLNTNRKFIGIELDKKYFNIAKQRIEEAKNNQISFKLGETYE